MSGHAARQRAYRERQRHGEAVLPLRVDYFRLIEALLVSGRLSEADALDRSRVKIAAGEVLDDWAMRWLQKIT